MNAYQIRLKDSHEAVGILFCESPAQLFWSVDECTDPYSCEYRTLPAGGILWLGKAETIPAPDYVEETDEGGTEDMMVGSSLSEYWYEAFTNETVKSRPWRDIPPDPKFAERPDIAAVMGWEHPALAEASTEQRTDLARVVMEGVSAHHTAAANENSPALDAAE